MLSSGLGTKMSLKYEEKARTEWFYEKNSLKLSLKEACQDFNSVKILQKKFTIF